MMPLRSNVSGELDAAPASAPQASPSVPSSGAWRCWTEAARPAFTAGDQVAEEADRVGDDLPTGRGCLGEDPEQQVLQLDDGLDDALDRVLRLVDEALVLRPSSAVIRSSTACRASSTSVARCRPAGCPSRPRTWVSSSNWSAIPLRRLLADCCRSSVSGSTERLDLGRGPRRCALRPGQLRPISVGDVGDDRRPSARRSGRRPRRRSGLLPRAGRTSLSLPQLDEPPHPAM